jgi:hypothetical protein
MTDVVDARMKQRLVTEFLTTEGIPLIRVEWNAGWGILKMVKQRLHTRSEVTGLQRQWQRTGRTILTRSWSMTPGSEQLNCAMQLGLERPSLHQGLCTMSPYDADKGAQKSPETHLTEFLHSYENEGDAFRSPTVTWRNMGSPLRPWDEETIHGTAPPNVTM